MNKNYSITPFTHHGKEQQLKIKLVGIDPAMVNFGFAIAQYDLISATYEIEKLILVKTAIDKKERKVVRKSSDDLRRARLLHTALHFACRDAVMAMCEMPVGSQNAAAMKSYGMCLGVIASCPVSLVQLTPEEVKMAAVGHRQAAKEEMIEWAINKFPGANWLTERKKGVVRFLNNNEHLADAVGTIEAGIQTDDFQRAVAIWRNAPRIAA